MSDFMVISALIVLGLVFFCIYFFFKILQFVMQAINLYKDMVVRQDAMIKILIDIRDSSTVAKENINSDIKTTTAIAARKEESKKISKDNLERPDGERELLD